MVDNIASSSQLSLTRATWDQEKGVVEEKMSALLLRIIEIEKVLTP